MVGNCRRFDHGQGNILCTYARSGTSQINFEKRRRCCYLLIPRQRSLLDERSLPDLRSSGEAYLQQSKKKKGSRVRREQLKQLFRNDTF